MDVIEIDPNELEVDELNERTENVGPHKDKTSLEDSIREQGVIEPPVVRQDNGSYKVVVGQRRTLAAQGAGVDKIPVVVADWDDAESLTATITENVDAFRKSVSRSDRAAAVQKLMDVTDWSRSEVAEKLGIHRGTLDEWLERTKEEWKDTDVHVETPDKRSKSQSSVSVGSLGDASQEETTSVDLSDDSQQEYTAAVDKVDDKSLAAIRRATGGGEEGERLVKKVAESDASQRDILEAEQRAKRGEDFENALDEIVSQKPNKGEIRVRTQVTFTGNYAEGLRELAKERGTSEDEVVRQAIKEHLTNEGYL
jgi:ParB/RepB/Spo0J family partition protein